jgi:hypothetical protein
LLYFAGLKFTIRWLVNITRFVSGPEKSIKETLSSKEGIKNGKLNGYRKNT